MTDDPTPEEDVFYPPEVKAEVQEEEPVEFYSPEPSDHVSNLTPDLPQPEGFKDHRDIVAEGEAAARAYLAEVEAEYGKYRANQDIYHGGVVAYLAGSPVPVANVKLHKYDEDGLVDEVK